MLNDVLLDSICGQSWLPGRSIVVQALAARATADPSGRFVFFSLSVAGETCSFPLHYLRSNMAWSLFGYAGRIVVLDDFCPWKEHLHRLEKEMGIEGQILYVLYKVCEGLGMYFARYGASTCSAGVGLQSIIPSNN